MRIYWTSYHYSAPRPSDDDRLTAYLYPGKVRRAYLHELAAASVVPVFRLLALGFLLVIALDDAGNAIPWWILLPMWWVILSFGLSSASFSMYALRTLAFWEGHILSSRGYEREERRRLSTTMVSAADREVSTGPWIVGITAACLLVAIGLAMIPGASAARPSAVPAAAVATAAPAAVAPDTACIRYEGACLVLGTYAPAISEAEERAMATPGTRPFHRYEPYLLERDSLVGTDSALLARGIEQAIVEAEDLLRDFELPHPLTISAATCRGGATYSPSTHQVTVCTSWVKRVRQRLARDYPVSTTRDAVRFAIAHEVGHALVDAYNLPVLGREEDAADQFAAYQFLSHRRELPVISMLAAFEATQMPGLEDARVAMGDAHGLALQRRDNLACWLYAADTVGMASLVTDLPPSRREGCPAEARRMRASWDALLAPHRRRHGA